MTVQESTEEFRDDTTHYQIKGIFSQSASVAAV